MRPDDGTNNTHTITFDDSSSFGLVTLIKHTITNKRQDRKVFNDQAFTQQMFNLDWQTRFLLSSIETIEDE